jgi:hypothetical protein
VIPSRDLQQHSRAAFKNFATSTSRSNCNRRDAESSHVRRRDETRGIARPTTLVRLLSRFGPLAAAMQHLRTKNVRINDRSLIAQFGSSPSPLPLSIGCTPPRPKRACEGRAQQGRKVLENQIVLILAYSYIIHLAPEDHIMLAAQLRYDFMSPCKTPRTKHLWETL